MMLLFLVTLLLVGGGLARFAGPVPADILWAADDAVTLVPATAWVIADLRAGRYGADLLALLALASTLAVGEFAASGRPSWPRGRTSRPIGNVQVILAHEDATRWPDPRRPLAACTWCAHHRHVVCVLARCTGGEMRR